jgi:hypothetical protein
MRTVHFYDGTWTLGTIQPLYLDGATRRLIPNVSLVRSDGSPFFDINEVGLKGDPIDPTRRLAVVWGDSVVFGIGQGWPCLLDRLVPGYQFLNGGIEGDDYRNVLQRMVEFNRERPVSLNILFPGWHPHGQNRELAADLINACRGIPNPVLLTLPTALNSRIARTDLTSYFSAKLADWETMYWVSELTDPDFRGFYFYGFHEYSVSLQADAFAHVLERNSQIREAGAMARIPVIDLFAAFDTGSMADFRADFFDILHPRPSAYPKLAQAVYAGIRHLV